ncbi:MAG: hypothetical protein VKS61_13840 [Candidatus Sericytochromatia bacterium]|nr:hypothetical protein [Candidatus Sericytochromatia bacterium]
MADITTSAAAPATGSFPTQKPLAAKPEEAPQAPKMGTDTLALAGAPRADEHQYFGHQPRVTLSWVMKQPLWADDRSAIKADQWAKMPESQRQDILAMMPHDAARSQFLSGMDPNVAAAREQMKDLAKRAISKINELAEREREKRAAEAGKTPPQ